MPNVALVFASGLSCYGAESYTPVNFATKKTKSREECSVRLNGSGLALGAAARTMALVRSPSVEFVDLMLTIEGTRPRALATRCLTNLGAGGRPSAQSFSLLFDLVSDGSLVSAHSSGLDFLHVFFEMSKRVNYKTQVSLIRKLWCAHSCLRVLQLNLQ